jgi:hypothetical protein
MGLTFAKKSNVTAAPAAQEAAASTAATNPAAKFKSTTPEKPKAKFSVLARGAEAKKLVAEREAQIEARKIEQGRMRRFFMKYGEDTQVTFLDGSLDEDGMLDVPKWKEHFVRVGNDIHNFICTAGIDKTVPCPLCEGGDEPSLVGALTIIDHTKYTVTKRQNAGKTFQHQKKLFIAKDGTLKTLSKLASKPERNGLALCTFDVSRGPESKKPPAVGDTFDFVTKHKSLGAIAEKYGLNPEEVGPADYDEEIVYLPPEKLIELGYGKKPSGVGYEKGVSKAADDL